ncbi:uncharacterized protein LOC142475018 [Ascaphus truei]|uniref:uncharacterized protein LOC142475018 n=1 Tax=Ascaphus truei TaxID=8439 RepID=UPI003F598638
MVATLKRKYEEALKQMTVFQQEVHTLRIELNASQQEVNSVRIEVDVSQKEVQTLCRALDASHHETNSCRTDLEVSRKELHSLTEKETIANLNTNLQVSQKELQTLNLEKDVSRQETVVLKADVRKWKEDCKEALNSTETEKGEHLRLQRKNVKLKEENFNLTNNVKEKNEKLHELKEIDRLLEGEKFEAEHRLQNQLQGLCTHLEKAEEKQRTLQDDNLQAVKEIQVLQESLMTQYVPAKQHEKLKATLSITKATLKAKLRTQVTRHKREHKMVQKLKQVTVAQAKKFIVLHNAIKMWKQAQRKQSMQINYLRRDLQDALKKQGSLADEITVLQGQVLTLTKRQYPTPSKTHEDKGTVRAGNTAHLKDKVAKCKPPKQALAKPSATQQATKEGTRAELKPEESLADEAEKMGHSLEVGVELQLNLKEAELATPLSGKRAERQLQEQKTERAVFKRSATAAIQYAYNKTSTRREGNLMTAHVEKRLYLEKVLLERLRGADLKHLQEETRINWRKGSNPSRTEGSLPPSTLIQVTEISRTSGRMGFGRGKPELPTNRGGM